MRNDRCTRCGREAPHYVAVYTDADLEDKHGFPYCLTCILPTQVVDQLAMQARYEPEGGEVED